MDFGLSMEQEILRNSVRQFAEKEIQPVAAELDEKDGKFISILSVFVFCGCVREAFILNGVLTNFLK